MSNVGEETFGKRFARLALVNVLATLMVPLAGLVDVAFLGHLDAIEYLAGVALAAVLFDTLYWGLGFLRMGTTGTTAQAMGRGDMDAVLLTGLRGVVLAMGFGVAILLLAGPLESLGFWVLRGEAGVELAGRAYWAARIWAAPVVLLNFVFIGWYLGREQVVRVLILSLVGNLSNVVLDYYLIVVRDLGAWGAGMATALAQVLVLAVALAMWVPDLGAMWRVRSRVLEAEPLRALLVLNRDIMFRTLALIVTLGAFTNLGAALGTIVLASNALLFKVQLLASYLVDGLAYATETLAGGYAGAERRDLLRRLVRVASLWGMAIGIGVALLFAIFPDPLYGLLTDHADVLARARRDTWWLVPVLSIGSVAFILDGYFIGLTAGRVLARSMIFSSLVGFAPLAAAAWYWHSPDLLWAAMTAWMVLRSGTLLRQVPATLTVGES